VNVTKRHTVGRWANRRNSRIRIQDGNMRRGGNWCRGISFGALVLSRGQTAVGSGAIDHGRNG